MSRKASGHPAKTRQLSYNWHGLLARADEQHVLAMCEKSGGEAVLVDNDQPRPGTGTLSDRSFHLMRPGSNGSWFRIESSTNLIHWTALCTNVVTDGAIHFVDPETENLGSRFYRAVPETNPPVE